MKKENDVSSFMYYMWNAWCKEECEIVFGYEYSHFWEKWCGYNNGHFGSVEEFYASLSGHWQDKLVERATEVYNGRGRRK